MKNILDKFKIYGPRKFLFFAFLEAKRILLLQFIKKSFSQYGEDLIIDSLLHNKHRGFYVDVGAYDPHRISNTKRFYLKGWKGINIEPDESNFQSLFFLLHEKFKVI